MATVPLLTQFGGDPITDPEFIAALLLLYSMLHLQGLTPLSLLLNHANLCIAQETFIGRLSNDF